MFFRKEKYWTYFYREVLACNEEDATLLYLFLKLQQMERTDIDSFEIIDIRRYRLITKKYKVAEFLKRKAAEMTFIFPVNKN